MEFRKCKQTKPKPPPTAAAPVAKPTLNMTKVILFWNAGTQHTHIIKFGMSYGGSETETVWSSKQPRTKYSIPLY